MFEIGEAEVEATSRVIRSGRLFRYQTGSGGESETSLLEKEFAVKIGVSYSQTVTSGTAALICALVGLGVGPEDEVIVPGYTFMATALAPLAVGAVPVLAEVDASLMLDPTDVEKKITPRTRVIIPVHMNGNVCDLEPILRLARMRGIRVLEDCCQCAGGSYRGLRVGSHGDVGAFSFNLFKNITAGEGGAVTTNELAIFHRARIYHDGGCAFRPDAKGITVPFFAGVNYRMDEIRSAMLRVQLSRLDGILDALRRRCKRLRELLSDLPEVELSPVHDLHGVCGSHLFLHVQSRAHALEFQKAATERKISTSLPYDSGRHVFCNWEPLLERRGAHHAACDPLHITAAGRAQTYTRDMLPKTLDNLARTVFVGINHRWTEEELQLVATSLRESAQLTDCREHTR